MLSHKEAIQAAADQEAALESNTLAASTLTCAEQKNGLDPILFDSESWLQRSKRIFYQQKKKHRVTKPKPFAMTVRDETAAPTKTIAQRRMEEDLEKKRLEEELELSKKFRANPVPASSLLPRYDQIVIDAAKQSMDHRQSTQGRLEKSRSAFKYYDKERSTDSPISLPAKVVFLPAQGPTMKQKHSGRRPVEAKKEEEFQQFKAKDIPKGLFEGPLETDAQRKARLAARAKHVMDQSAMPARMQMYADNKRNGKVGNSRHQHADELTFRPNINPIIPDHRRQQYVFQQVLEMRRKNRHPIMYVRQRSKGHAA